MGAPRKEASERFHIIMTWRCDGNCPGCIFLKYLKKGKGHDMPVSTQKRVVAKIGRFHDISILGGEPTIHPRFWKMLEEIVAKKPERIRVISNGISFSASEAGAKRFFLRFNKIAKKAAAAGTNIVLIVSVGDMHAKGLKGGEIEMKARIQNILRASKQAREFSFNFLAELAPKQSRRKVIRKYRLPKSTPARLWQLHPTGGTVPKTVIDPRGRVFGNEAALASGQKPIGHIRMPLAQLYRNMKIR